MNQEMKYEAAMTQLEDIVRRMENNEMGLDELGEQIKTAQQLIKLCKDRLTKTEEEVQRIVESSK